MAKGVKDGWPAPKTQQPGWSTSLPILPSFRMKKVGEVTERQPSFSCAVASSESKTVTKEEVDGYECEYECGFIGSFSAVEFHELTCNAGNPPHAGPADPIRPEEGRIYKNNKNKAAPRCGVACTIM